MFLRCLRTGMCLLGLALVILGSVGVASAHARPVNAVPPMDGTVKTAPTEVLVTFGEGLDMSGSTLVVTGPGGATVSQGSATQLSTDIKAMSVQLQSGLADGTYTVQWTSKSSDDGDSANGSFTFTVSASAAATPVAPTQLPSTGALDAHSMILWLGLAGFGLLLTGVALRRRWSMTNRVQ